MKIVANLKYKMIENEECQWVTISVLMAGTAQSERGVDETDRKKKGNYLLWEKIEFCFVKPYYY